MAQPFEYKLVFSEHYPKLDLPIFTTIRLDRGSNYYFGNRIYAIYEKKEKRGFAMLVAKIKQMLGTIPLPFIHFDTYASVSKQDFFDKMAQWYSKTGFWHGQETLMLILFLLWVEKWF